MGFRLVKARLQEATRVEPLEEVFAAEFASMSRFSTRLIVASYDWPSGTDGWIDSTRPI